jgi:hypothetical protein
MQKVRIFLVAATFEKAKTYVFIEPVVRDREVGGSNPLAPTIKTKTHGTTAASSWQPFLLWPNSGQKFESG